MFLAYLQGIETRECLRVLYSWEWFLAYLQGIETMLSKTATYTK